MAERATRIAIGDRGPVPSPSADFSECCSTEKLAADRMRAIGLRHGRVVATLPMSFGDHRKRSLERGIFVEPRGEKVAWNPNAEESDDASPS